MNPLGSFSFLPWQNKIFVRETLTANRTYYVSTTGSDANNGLTRGTPFLTIQKAVDIVCLKIDIQNYQVTIQLADGTYNQAVTLDKYIGNVIPIIRGNSASPQSVTIYYDSDVIYNGSYSKWMIQDISLYKSGTSQWTSCLSAGWHGGIVFSNIRFGANSGSNTFHLLTRQHGVIMAYGGSYTIFGGAARHINCEEMGEIKITDTTITILNNPNFSTAFCTTFHNGCAIFYSDTFIGSATGIRYQAAHNSTIDTQGRGSTYLPGNSSGTVSQTGVYT